MSDLIDRQAALDVVNDCGICIQKIFDLPSAEPWDVVKTILKELEQKEERLCADYCDATARLKAINKIAESSQTPKRMIDGIKPLAEMEVTE